MKNIIVILCLISLVVSCKKPEGDDLSGENEIRGSVFINDSLRSLPEEQPLANHPILIKRTDDSTSTNYLYSVNSDQAGNFVITNLSNEVYYLYAEKEVNGLKFTGRVAVNAGESDSVKLVLYPDASKYNILIVTTRDSISDGRLFNSRVCLFTSSYLAKTNDCDGSIDTENSSQLGKAIFSRLDTGWYYVNAQLSVGNVNIKGRDSIRISSRNGIYSLPLYLK